MIDGPALALMVVLGLRHGLDPDHVAVIDNIVFRTVDERPRQARWTGTLFALGHSASVAAVAIAVSLAAGALTPPSWAAAMIDALVFGLLLLVGTSNLAALLREGSYVPTGWRSTILPGRLRGSTRPAGVAATGLIFGLVFDTATQAAAWGAAATVAGGLPMVIAIVLAFSIGMVATDTLDSQIVARLLRSPGRSGAVIGRYRRAVGWLIVALSYGMAALALAGMLGGQVDLPDRLFTMVGVGAACLVIALLTAGRLKGGASSRNRYDRASAGSARH